MTPSAPPAPPENDMSAQVAARQRARAAASAASPATVSGAGSDAAAPDDETERSNRSIAANLGSLRAPAPGENARRGGGVFQIRRMGYEDAEFMFFGWNKEMLRNNTQTIEVRRGDNPDMRIAVVRKMIGIIRDHEKGDFVWESRRQGRNVSLSARLADTARLETFLLQEFF